MAQRTRAARWTGDGSRPGRPATRAVDLDDGRRCEIRAFPQDDRLLGDVIAVAERLQALGHEDAGDLRSTLESTLRHWYPRLVVRERDTFAAYERHSTVWYVFRDGWVHTEDTDLDRLHAVLADARDASDESERAIKHAEQTLARAMTGRPARRADATLLRAEGEG